MTVAAAFWKLLLHTPLAAWNSRGTGPVRYFYVSGKRPDSCLIPHAIETHPTGTWECPLCPQNFGSVGVKC